MASNLMKMKIVSVSSEWVIADRFAEYLEQHGISAKVRKATAYHVEVPRRQVAKADKVADGFDPNTVVTELLEPDGR